MAPLKWNSSLIVFLFCLCLRSLTAEAAEEKKKGNFGGLAVLEATTNLYSRDDSRHSSSSTLYLIPTYKLSNLITLIAYITADQEFTDEKKTSLRDTKITTSFAGPELNPFIKLNPRLSVYAPTGTESVRRQSQVGRLQAAARLPFDFEKAGIPLSGFYELGITRYFHQFETSTEGKSNNRYTIGHFFWGDLELPLNLTFTTKFQFTSAWTNQGTLKGQFDISEELSYNFTEEFYATVGHTNASNSLKANGQDFNIVVFDGNTSQLYGSVTLKF